MWTKVSVVMVV